MEFKCIEKCGEVCQRRIGIALIILFALISIGGLLQILISIARSAV